MSLFADLLVAAVGDEEVGFGKVARFRHGRVAKLATCSGASGKEGTRR
jgi:hypothetical protein